MEIAFFSTKSYDKEYFGEANKAFGFKLSWFEVPLNSNTVAITPEKAVVCSFVNDYIDQTVVDVLSRKEVGLIALRCAGFNQVDLEAVARAGIKVVRVPSYSPHAVAEHALALLLTLNRKTHKAYNRIREGNFSLERLIGFDINGKTAGVIGTGKIGAVFAGIMQGIGCRVIAYDPFPNKELINKGVAFFSVEEVLRQSDIISLHCPLTPETHHIIGKKALEIIKPGAVLINTSRGGLVDSVAAIEALKSHRLGALGIDVYEQEENLFFKDLSDSIIDDEVILRLMTFPNVLVTSHQAFLTKEALQQIAGTTLQNIRSYQQKDTLTNEVK